MRASLKILWNSLVNAYDAAFAILLSNIFFALLCLPMVTIPLAIAGVFYTNFQIASGESIDWKTFFEGIKRYWWAGIRWTLINLVVMFSLIFYYYLFSSMGEMWSSALLGLDLGIMAFWILMQFLTFPMMLMQEKPGFLLSLRNTMVFLVRWPRISFTFYVPILILVIVSTFLFPPLWIFLTVGLVTYLGSYLVFYCIDSERHPELYKDPKHS